MARFRPGLRAKLALAISIVLFVALGVTYLAVYRGTGNELEDRTEVDLEREAERLEVQLASGRADDPDGYLRRARYILDAESFGPNARVIVVTIPGAGVATNQPALIKPGIAAGEGKSESEDDHELRERTENAGRILEAEEGFSTIEVDDVGEIRLLTNRTFLPGRVPAEIQVGQPLAPVDTALEGLSDTFFVVGAATLILGALAGWLLASSATRPMRRMATVAGIVDSGDLSARMPVGGTRDEARRLAEAFNGMLDTLEDAFERQRAFVADASHDLRTPLTVVRGQVEVLARDPDPSPDEVARVSALVTREIDRMERMVGDLLLLARTEDASHLVTQVVELEPLLESEIDAASLVSDVELVLGPVTTRTVAVDLGQFSRVISNLIANGVAHAKSRVETSAMESGDRVVVFVDDDGPGVPPGERDRIFDRFTRLDQSRNSSAGGTGLGLAIVKAITVGHGGRVECSESPIGGARFSVSLPAAGPNTPG